MISLAEPGKQQRRFNSHDRYTAFDRALISAKRDDRLVLIEFMGVEDREIAAKVCSVDRYFIEVEIVDPNVYPKQNGPRRWINKAWIASVGVE